MAVRGSKPTKNEGMDDDELQQLITERIDEDAAFWAGGARRRASIMVEVDEGHVTLTGTVRTPLDRRRADILARALGAVSVDNRLQVAAESGRASEEPRRKSA